MSAILFQCPWDTDNTWSNALHSAAGDLEIRHWPDYGDPADIDTALVWKPPAEILTDFPNLRLLHSLGAGVDHIFEAGKIRPGVTVARLVDPVMADRMAEYVTAAVLRYHRRFDVYEAQQRKSLWRHADQRDANEVTVGILGLGSLGAACGDRLSLMGYKVIGWSRSPKSFEQIGAFHGDEGFETVLTTSDALVILLPLTPHTDGLMTAEIMRRMKPGSHLINVARGRLVDQAGLIEVLDSGPLSGATLDVFSTEPLPEEDPLWAHSKVFITPHISSLSNAATAIPQMLENIKRMRAGEAVLNTVDPTAGY